jgi:hypothetical protein
LPPLELAPEPPYQLTDDTTTALFILDALAPFSDSALLSAAEDLTLRLTQMGQAVRVAQRVIALH